MVLPYSGLHPKTNIYKIHLLQLYENLPSISVDCYVSVSVTFHRETKHFLPEIFVTAIIF
jgi:hypothetical protein